MSKLKLPTLLAITDNPSVRFWIKKNLDIEFFIVNASKKETALAAAQTTPFDFIIVDSELEDCDPLELCQELKQILRSLTPILLITGRLKRSFLEAASSAGVTDFLNNQLNPEELQTRIATIRKGQSLREKTQDASSTLAQKREGRTSTHLKSRVRLNDQALKMFERAKKEGRSITALIIQIDRFDELQSKILSPFTNLIHHLLTPSDHLIPSSEGQFIVLLQNATPEEGRALAEQIRKGIHRETFQMTVSIFVSSIDGTESAFNQMLDSSFKALKTAKDLIISIDTEFP